MGNLLGVQQGQCIGHSHTVIPAQGSTPCKNVGTIVGQVQAVVLKVNGTVRLLLANHIHMALENHWGMVLIPRGARLEDHHIVPLVLPEAEASLLGKPDQVIADGLCIPGAVGNGTDFLKKTKHACRLQTGQGTLFHTKHSLFVKVFGYLAPFYHASPASVQGKSSAN